ncbi:MAG: choice-of-anchor J domain-containing protein [Bacteroidetes bacterium]|nr:choice-of-anchor J domain-containing protein [Bacteroidota bacterium]
MKLTLLSLFFTLLSTAFLQAQVLFQEDFEAGNIPAGWTNQTLATDGGCKVGTPSALSSQYWPVESNGSTRVAASNDDACNCVKNQDYLVMPPLDFSAVNAAVLSVDVFFQANTYQGATERLTVEVSLDNLTWTEVEDLHGHGGWDTHLLNLSAYAGAGSVYIAFHYNDGGGWLYGGAIDNVSVQVPALLDAKLTEVHAKKYGEEMAENHVSTTIFNNGVSAITSLEVSYSVNGGAPVAATENGLNIEPFTFYEFHHPTPWTADASGLYNVTVEITAVNGGPDEDAANNSLSAETEIFPHVVVPNRIDEFLLAAPVFTTIATSTNQLDKPTDLDFFPILGKNELWVVNERTETLGGSTLTIYDPDAADPEFLQRVDGNAWHFMSLPTGIAFSDNFNFATSPGVQDANHSGGTFTGPALWSSDPDIYAQPSGGNGSHLDMLHGSPFSMGIASEADNVFWVFDGWNQTIVRYDFQGDHGPGNDDHANGVVRRYTEISVKKDANIPSHLVLDKATGWLYAVDNGNDRVLRLDINSGSVVGSLPLINEPLAEHSEMGGVDWEVIVQDSIERPCGIEVMGNRLLVGDYTSGDIYVFDIENGFAELGRIATGQAGLTGIKVGPDGAIWYTNRLQNSLTKVVPGEVSATGEQAWESSISVSPNPTSGNLLVRLPEMPAGSEVSLEVSDLTGRKLLTKKGNASIQQLDLGNLSGGLYLLSIRSGAFFATRKVVLEK